MTINVPAEQTSTAVLDDAASASAGHALPAEHRPAASFAVEWRSLAQLEPIADEWRALAARAIEANVFYEPAVALAAAPVCGEGIGAVLVWSAASRRELLGFFPARIQPRRYGIKLPVLVGWTHPYAPLGAPLVDREAPQAVIDAWLAHVAADPALPGLLLLPFLPEEGPLAAALEAVMRHERMPAADFNRHRRALLVPRGEPAGYTERTFGRRRHRELRRVGRRLAEIGAPLFASATERAAVAVAVEDFLALEASGWKGRAGTAAANHDDLRHFIRTAVCALAAEGKAGVNRLMLDGRAIAAAITLRSGRGAWFWKTAYDETFARLSPGVMLAVALTEELLGNPGITRTDSCATPNHPVMDHIWGDRLALCDRLIALRPRARFAAACRLEMLRRAAFAGMKRVRGYFRG